MCKLIGGAVLCAALGAFASPTSYETASRDGQRAFQQGLYADAASLLEGALLQAARFGEGDPRHIAALCDLGRAYQVLGRYADAEALYGRALVAAERELAPADPALALALASLADLYRAQGRAEEAEPLYRRALAIRERAHGADHLSVAETLHALAETRRAQGAYAEAERLYWRTVMIRSWIQGAAHAALWPTFKGLGDVNRALGRTSEASLLYARAAAIAEKAVPAAINRGRLGDFSVGDSEAAIDARGSSVSLLLMPGTPIGERKRLEAGEHPEIGRQLEGIAELYRAQGRLIEAIDVLRRALPIREKTLGPDHPEVARAYRVMAALLADQRDGRASGGQSAADPARR